MFLIAALDFVMLLMLLFPMVTHVRRLFFTSRIINRHIKYTHAPRVAIYSALVYKFNAVLESFNAGIFKVLPELTLKYF